MTANEYLSQVEDLNECIEQDLRRRHDKYSMTKGIDYAGDKVQSSPDGDQLTDRVYSIIKLDRKIEKEIMQYLDAREKIIGQIRGLHDARYNQILYGHYVERKSLKQIWVEMKQGRRTVLRWLDEALLKFEELYADEMTYLY